MRNNRIPQSFRYGGEMEISRHETDGWHKITMHERDWVVVEYLPYEPANYVHEPIFLVMPAESDGNYPLYCITAEKVFPEPVERFDPKSGRSEFDDWS